MKPESLEEMMKRWEASLRRLNAEVYVDPLDEGMNHDAEAEARHAIGPSRYVPREPHLCPREDE